MGHTQRAIEKVLRAGRDVSWVRIGGVLPPLLRVPVCTEWLTVLFSSQYILVDIAL
jgi:hypothetical protein